MVYICSCPAAYISCHIIVILDVIFVWWYKIQYRAISRGSTLCTVVAYVRRGCHDQISCLSTLTSGSHGGLGPSSGSAWDEGIRRGGGRSLASNSIAGVVKVSFSVRVYTLALQELPVKYRLGQRRSSCRPWSYFNNNSSITIQIR